MLNFEVLKALALLCKSKEEERGFVAVLSGYLVGRSDRPAVGTDSRAEDTGDSLRGSEAGSEGENTTQA